MARTPRARLDRQTVDPSDGLNLETDSWAQMGDSLQMLAQQWRECGWLKGWRGEKFDICDQSGKPLCALERAAFRPFG